LYHITYLPEDAMPKVLPTEDVRPLSEFRANAAAFVNQVRATKRPLILTQHGRSAAVLLDVKAYEDLIEHAELLHDIEVAEAQIAEGKFIEHDDFKKYMFERLVL
jgi:prevent-host-death family protein